MSYECPECRSTEKPKVLSYFAPKICQCIKCGKKANEKDFIKKKDRPYFSPLPPPPPR